MPNSSRTFCLVNDFLYAYESMIVAFTTTSRDTFFIGFLDLQC